MNPQSFSPLHLFRRCSGEIISLTVQFSIRFQQADTWVLLLQ